MSPMQYVTREGPITAGDARTALTTQGSVTTPGTLTVPPGKTKIVQIITSVGDNTPTAADGAHCYFITLSGDGVAEGEQTLVIGAAYSDFTTAGESGFVSSPLRQDVDIAVEPGGVINVYAEATLGTLWGVPEVSVTLGFA